VSASTEPLALPAVREDGTVASPTLSSRPQSIFSGRPLDRTERAVVAVLVGVASCVVAWAFTHGNPATLGKDFTYPWRAARALLAGQNPYDVILPHGGYPTEGYFPYPLPAAFPAIPFAWLPVRVAAGVFFGCTAALFTYAFVRDGLWRLWACASMAYWLSMGVVNWSPLLVAGALLPAFGWVLALKPTIGLALFAYRPSRAAFIGGLVVVLLSLAVVPRWPIDWLFLTGYVTAHHAPITRPWGWLPLLALLRWRRPEARLVAVMSLIPQNIYFYDQLALWLIPWNALTTLFLSAASWIAALLTVRSCSSTYCGPDAEQWVLLLIYAPATLMALARPAHPRRRVHAEAEVAGRAEAG
jgi:hypothetical protein